MGIVTGIRAVDKYWLCTNFTQATLSSLYEGGEGIYTDKFKYTCDKSDSTDLNDIYFEITVNAYRDRGGTSPWGKIRCRYKMSAAQMAEISSDNVDEIVLAYSRAGEQSSAEIELVEDGTDRYFQLVNIGNTIGYFQAFYRDKDGHVVTRVLGDTMDLVNITFSSAKYLNGNWVDGYPREWEGSNVYYAFSWINSNNNSKGAVDGLYFNVAQSTSFRASHLTFANPEDAVNYLLTGEGDPLDEDGSGEEPAVDRITTLFYASNIYSRVYNNSNLQRLGASTIYIDIQYAKNDGTIIVDKNRAICGYVNTNNAINDENHFGNIIWMAANNVKILETKQSWLNGGFADTKTLPQFATTTGFYGPLIDGNTIYESRYNTNMRIFANRADAEDFLRGGNPTPIGGGTNAGQFNPDKLVGDPTVYNNPTADISADMSSCWILTKSEVDELANILATGLTSQESEENGILVNTLLTTGRSFSAHAEPIDAIVDLFWLPFNPREFSNNDYDHLVFAEDKYCSFEALGEAVDAAGQAVKGAYSNPVGRAFLPGGVFVNAYESGKAVGEKIASVIDVGETLNKFNIVSNIRDGMN